MLHFLAARYTMRLQLEGTMDLGDICLIRAAPKLLTAAKLALDLLSDDEFGEERDVYMALKEAIDEAEGR